MPGVGGHRFQWKQRPPLYWSVLAVILVVYGVALAFSSHLLPYLTESLATGNHAHAVTVAGHTRYMSPLVWWLWDKGEWICVVLALSLILIMILKRHQIERVG